MYKIKFGGIQTAMRSAYNKEIYYNQFKKIINLDEPNEVLPFSNAILSLTGNQFPVKPAKKIYDNPDRSFKLLFPVLNCGVYFIWNHNNYSVRKYDYTIDTDLKQYNEQNKFDLVIMRYLDGKEISEAKLPKRKYKDINVLLMNIYNFLRLIERREPESAPIGNSIKIEDLRKPNILNRINKRNLEELRDALVYPVLDDLKDDFHLISKAIEKFYDIDEEDYSFLNVKECKASDILFLNRDTILRVYKVYNRNGKYKYTARLIDRDTIGKRFNMPPVVSDKDYIFAISHNNRSRYITENNIDTKKFKKMGVNTDDHFLFMLSSLSAVFMETYLLTHGPVESPETKSYISNNIEVDFSDNSTRIEIKDNISISTLEEIIEDTNIFNGVDNGVLEFLSDCIRDHNKGVYYDISNNGGGDETLFFMKFHKNGCYYKIMSSYDNGGLSLDIANDFELYLNLNIRHSLSFSFYIGDVYGDNEIYILDSTEYDNDEFLDNFRKAIKFYLYQRENNY